MNRLAGLVIAGLVFLLGVTPSWGGPPNPTASDANANTAGGTNALLNVTSGTVNTAGGGRDERVGGFGSSRSCRSLTNRCRQQHENGV